MKRRLMWMLGVLMACSFTMTAVAACGDDEEDAATNAVGEACIVAVLPNAIAPYANLEVTYYDVQGMARSFVVKNGETSDDLSPYAKTALGTLELMSGFTFSSSKSIIRTVKFAVPSGTKITCKYKVVLNGSDIAEYPSKAYSPFAVATGKRGNGEELAVQGTVTIAQTQIPSLEVFKSWLDTIKDTEKESYVVVN